MGEVLGRKPDGVTGAVRLRVLGPVVVTCADGSEVEPSGRRAKAFLVALALAGATPRGVAALTDDIWGDDAPRGAKAALQTLVSRLRAAVGDGVIESHPAGYRLAAGVVETDLAAASSALVRARTLADSSPPEWAAVRQETDGALALWRGEPGGDLDDGPLAAELRDRAASLEHDLALLAAGAALALGDAARAEAIARRIGARSPFDDSAHALLMRALDELGRPTEAMGVFAEFRERVRDAFGASPSQELQALNLELLGREPASAEAESGSQANRGVRLHGVDETPDSPAIRTRAGVLSSAPHRAAVVRGLRAAPNPLIGRDDALREIEHLLGRSRVTTVLGAGGLGKTRVAQEVAARAVRTMDAVFVVELAGVRSGDDVLFAIASGLGIREASGNRLGDQVMRADLRTRILTRLDGQRTLLVLDNCEHLVEAAAEWCSSLTAELPALTVLTTSRTPLAISSERVYALPPLGGGGGAGAGSATAPPSSLDLADDPAVQLFVDRATAARPGALLPLPAVARLCERLDGLPLAIELAAARIRSLPLDEIERRLSNRFALLTSGDRSAPERHRTLTAVIEWSWNLLATAEQRALARLSEFAGGFAPEAAREVVGVDELEAADLLDALVAQSLVTLTESPHGARYRMLETVREFGQSKLAESGHGAEVQDALFGWADGFSLRQRPRIDGAEQVAAIELIAEEEDNLIDVLRRAIDAGRPEIVASLFAMLGYFWSLRSAHSEVIAFSKPVFAGLADYRPEQADAAGDPDSHERRLDELALALVIMAGTTLLVDLRFGVRPLSRLRRLTAEWTPRSPRLAAMIALVLAASDESRLRAVIATATASDDRETALFGAMVGSVAAENEGRRDDAIALARRVVGLAGHLHDTWGGAMGAQMLGALHSQSGRPAEALLWARRARTGLAQLGAEGDLRQLEWVIASNQIAVGELEQAQAVFERLAVSPGELDPGVETTSIGLSGLAEVRRAAGLFEEGRALYAKALESFEAPRTRSSPWYRILLSADLAALCLDGTGTAEERRLLARRLRSRVLASLRAQGGYADRPVLGASIVGLAAWLQSDVSPDGRSAAGLELLALAHAMAARQDTPALRLAPLLDRFARAAHPEPEPAHPEPEPAHPEPEPAHPEPVAAALDAALALPDAERPGRVAELLRASGPWSWPRQSSRSRELEA